MTIIGNCHKQWNEFHVVCEKSGINLVRNAEKLQKFDFFDIRHLSGQHICTLDLSRSRRSNRKACR
jgi:hypothetical protein